MCLPAHNLGDVNVPTKEQLKELEANVEYLQKEHGKRLNTFKELKQSIQTLWKEIETVPSTSIEKELAKSDAETTFKLSSDNMEHLRGLNTELENQQKRLIAESSELTETIKSLWSKLEVDESDRKVFLEKHVGSKPSVITKLKEEFQRLQALKLDVFNTVI
nr:protein regulator of cytokinesis 1-like [Pocillopora verrucosa]